MRWKIPVNESTVVPAGNVEPVERVQVYPENGVPPEARRVTGLTA
jgi:hypothetical protein